MQKKKPIARQPKRQPVKQRRKKPLVEQPKKPQPEESPKRQLVYELKKRLASVKHKMLKLVARLRRPVE